MKTIAKDLIIIGAGLCGLTLAYRLRATPLDLLILEARDRSGGRILTTRYPDQTHLEMGATWLGKKHRQLVQLLEALALPVIPQKMGPKAIYEAISTSPPMLVDLPESDDPSYKIQGGTGKIIDTLLGKINTETIQFQQAVHALSDQGEKILVETETAQYTAPIVISTLPPYLLANSISSSPPLPKDFQQIANSTHTWMGESIKIALRFKQAFWQAANSSGTIVSNVGPIPELYDHSDEQSGQYSLIGFLNASYFSVTKAQRLDIILQQLRKYYGDQVDLLEHYEEVVWAQEPYTFRAYPQSLLPHQHNGHPIFQEALMGGKLHLGGSETAQHFPGYMEGAVARANALAKEVEERIWRGR